MSSSGIHVGEGVRRGGLAPNSPEAAAAIERVRQLMNPSRPRKYGHAPAWSIQAERAAPNSNVTPQPGRQPRARRMPDREVACDECKTVFTASGKTPLMKYCGPVCRKAASNRMARETYARKKAGAVRA